MTFPVHALWEQTHRFLQPLRRYTLAVFFWKIHPFRLSGHAAVEYGQRLDGVFGELD